MAVGEDAPSGTVVTVNIVQEERCDYCRTLLPPAQNHNGLKRRFCRGSRCRSAWHKREGQLVLQRAREALRAALASLDELLK